MVWVTGRRRLATIRRGRRAGRDCQEATGKRAGGDWPLKSDCRWGLAVQTQLLPVTPRPVTRACPPARNAKHLAALEPVGDRVFGLHGRPAIFRR